MTIDVVVPTVGRPSLATLLEALARSAGPLPERVWLVDDRPGPARPVEAVPDRLRGRVTELAGGARGPAAARDAGWRASAADWVAFLDDDVVPAADWLDCLAADIVAAAADPLVAATQGRIHVPLPSGRRPTDWERNVAGLAAARWATADMAYRRDVLAVLDGFDEGFPRAYREDADLGLRATDAGWRILQGRRVVQHPVRPEGFWVSVRAQAGNADDARMRARHGPRWRERAGVPAGRRPRHLAVTACGALAAAGVAGLLAGGGRRWARPAAAGAAGWTAGTAELAWARIAPGPRTPAEVATMVATSTVLPVAAVAHWGLGWARVLRAGVGARRDAPARHASRTPGPTPDGRAGGDRTPAREAPAAVLLDRDGTLVVDVPYNGDPRRVTPVPGARDALDRLRAGGVRLAVVSNQSGIGRGLLTRQQVDAVNRRVEELIGPVDAWFVCPHAPGEGCACRKPAPGLVLAAAEGFGLDPRRCAVVGDIGADVEAAAQAGARGVLVPTPATRAAEVAAAPEVARDLAAAVELLLGRGTP